MSWFLYIIQCHDETLYTGISTDISRRVKEHNSGKGAFYTQNKAPVKLVYQEPITGGRSAALKRERQIKKLTRTEKLALIAGTYAPKVKKMNKYMLAALAEAKAGLKEGGIPIGSVIVCDGKIIGRGHNRRVQDKSAILHAEMAALENAGRLTAAVYKKCSLYTTLSPCSMCTGAILLYKIPRVVIGENQTFKGQEGALRRRGVKVQVLQDEDCIRLMRKFIKDSTQLWNEDIGV